MRARVSRQRLYWEVRQPASLRFSEPFRTVLRCTSSFERLKLRAPLLFFFFKMEEEGWRAAGVPRYTSVCSCQPHGHVDLPVRGGSSTTHHRSSVHRPITLACTHYTRRAPSPAESRGWKFVVDFKTCPVHPSRFRKAAKVGRRDGSRTMFTVSSRTFTSFSFRFHSFQF